MEYRRYISDDARATIDLFSTTFTEADSENEGTLIAELVRDLLSTTHAHDLLGFVAADGARIVGAIFFSRMSFDEPMEAFILAPVAVHPEFQGRGVGQALIRHGLQKMRARGVRIVTTYGDPAFYSKVGFEPISVQDIRPPFELSQPEGWLGQYLADNVPSEVRGRFTCVQAFNNPVYW